MATSQIASAAMVAGMTMRKTTVSVPFTLAILAMKMPIPVTAIASTIAVQRELAERP